MYEVEMMIPNPKSQFPIPNSQWGNPQLPGGSLPVGVEWYLYWATQKRYIFTTNISQMQLLLILFKHPGEIDLRV